MIRFSCPNCGKNLAVDDSKAGAVGTCPACRQKIKVPAPAIPAKAPPGADQPAPIKQAAPPANQPAQAKQPAPEPVAQATSLPSKGPEIPLGKASDLPYAFKKEAKPGPEPEKETKKKRRRKGKDSVGTIGYGLLGVPSKRAKERKIPEPELLPGVSYFKALLSLGLFGWGVGVVYTLMIGGAYVVLSGLLLGLALGDAGFTWFLFLVMKRGGTGSQKPMIIGVLGVFMLVSLFLLAHFTGAIARG
jgi:hypothetical protein